MIASSRPRLGSEAAARLACSLFGVEGSAEPLPSERDRNFLLRTEGNEQFVLKVSAANEDVALLRLQQKVLERLQRSPGTQRFRFPEMVPSVQGKALAQTQLEGKLHWVRLARWIDASPLARVRSRRPELLEQIGVLLGSLDRALEGLDDPAAERSLAWDLTRASELVAERAPAIADASRRDRVQRLTQRHGERLASLQGRLRRGIIHNDANDHNVLVGPVRDDRDIGPCREIVGLIDFGDLIAGWLAAEPAVATAYAMLGLRHVLAAAGSIARGYHRTFPLQEAEIEALFPLAVLRLCMSVCNSAVQRAAEPDQDYLSVSEQPAWETLRRIEEISPDFAACFLRDACGLEPCAGAPAVRGWLQKHGASAAAVIEAPLDRALVFDLSVGSTQMGGGAPGAFDMNEVAERLCGLLRRAGARVGVGRYDEARCWYGGELFAAPTDEAPRRRTVHLGIDLFLAPGAVVRAPIDGEVHSAQINEGWLDYGPTVILEHRPAPDVRFFTLYGHLRASSIASLQPGQGVRADDPIGEIGAPPENGGWPPHLHFQIFVEPLGHQGDFPGVAPPDERNLWLSLCPDPNLLLRIPCEQRHPQARSVEQILQIRRLHLGPSLGLSYRRPLHIVRGFRQFLYDAEGGEYLDAVNNVPHVGHAHPHVVQAAARQAAVLNTNTRYLHDHLARYIERLVEWMPAGLDVCYLVNSGSEANELAVRLARTYTGRRDMVVLQGAYHGNTSTLIDLSPYKHDGPGGTGAPDWVHVAPMPDPYRGPYRRDDPDCGKRYAERVVQAAQGADQGVAGFFAEPLMGCGGQIVPPLGFLRAAFEGIRSLGGVCIADEVQIGFGRVGSHRWAFEAQGAVPDIVTLGKPIGNGYPLAAVVTTRAIADAFANGMEYFSTFGGNPVACAVGLAVLDVLEDEALQNNARIVGARLLAGLQQLMKRHRLIGDVRGAGLYVGVELVRDRDSLEPAADAAGYVINRMRDHGILLSTDGPLHNVLKIKPPMCFSGADAERLVQTLDRVLGEGPCRHPDERWGSR